MDETGSEITELAMVGWINATLAFDGLLAAGPQFDREKVIAATGSFTDYTGGGLLIPIDWTTAHTPYTAADPDTSVPECTAVVRVEDGEFALVTEPDTPWLCWDAEAEGWTEPEQTNFE
jgi:hypothetical protein